MIFDESNRLQEQLDFVKLNKDHVLVGSGLNIIDEKGIKSKTYIYPTEHNDIIKRLSKALPFFPHSSAF